MVIKAIINAGPRSLARNAPGEETHSGIPPECPYSDIEQIMAHTDIGRMGKQAESFFQNENNDLGLRAAGISHHSLKRVLSDLYDERAMAYLRDMKQPVLLGTQKIAGESRSSSHYNTPRDSAIQLLEENMRLMVTMHVHGDDFFRRGNLTEAATELVDSFIQDVDAFIPHAFQNAFKGTPSVGMLR